MTDLQAAIARLASKRDWHLHDPTYQTIDDMARLAAEYINAVITPESRPFADDEPVTPELVERLGWSRIEEKYGMTWRSQQSPQKGTTLQFWPGGHFPWSVCRRTDFGMGIDDVTTFGQLAALCRGLGIPCEVKAARLF